MIYGQECTYVYCACFFLSSSTYLLEDLSFNVDIECSEIIYVIARNSAQVNAL